MPARSAAPVSEDRARPAQTIPGTETEIELVAATDETAVQAADEAVDALLDGGCPPGDVLVLTTGAEHPWAEHELSFGEDVYWQQQTAADDVFCAHASVAHRTQRRDVVVLAVNGGSDAQAAEALPLALTRAARRLIVCGDPERLRTLL